MTLDFGSDSGLAAKATLPTPASERRVSAQLRARIQRHRSAYTKLKNAVATMRPHIAVRNGRTDFALPAPSAREAARRLGIDNGLFSHLLKSLKARVLVASHLGPGSARAVSDGRGARMGVGIGGFLCGRYEGRTSMVGDQTLARRMQDKGLDRMVEGGWAGDGSRLHDGGSRGCPGMRGAWPSRAA
jgi:hypothetical protein